jgi:hypothetical protein
MGKSLVGDIVDAHYSVTLYGCSSMTEEQRVALCKIFSEVMESVLGSAKLVVETQYEYNRVVNQYFGTPLPLTASGDEIELVQRWEDAYQSSCDAAFASVFGDLSFVSDETHFEIQAERVDESRSDRHTTLAAAGWADANASG